jgi:hypothetical protein
MDPNIIMKSGCGRISSWEMKQRKFSKVEDEDIDKIDDSFIGKEVIILYKYPQLLCGNYHQDILYHGIFSEGLTKNCSYETHIWIKDFKKSKPGFLSKKRLLCENSNLSMYIVKT